MTREEAIRILDPETTIEALAEIEYYAGFSGHKAMVAACDKACKIAVADMRKMEEIENATALVSEIPEGDVVLIRDEIGKGRIFVPEERMVDVQISRGGHPQYSVRIVPLRGSDIDLARKRASVNGEKAVDMAAMKNWLIYLATIKEDRVRVWGRAQDVDTKLTAGEKYRLLNAIMKISGINEVVG